MLKKILYVGAGFIAGIVFILGAGELRAQLFDQASGGFQINRMNPPLPGRYGHLVAVSGIDMYFEDQAGNVYLVHPKTGGQLETTVTMVPRS